jgi:outer membrane protein OmpA-like peptidoglycan-associated protein
MKDKFDIVSGDFEGNFYTHQKSVLSASESTIDKKHDIHLYRGELRNIKNENEYKPEQLRNRESYLLHNVTNVQFHLEKDATGNKNRIYNFEQILLRDAVIKESWELNGKTYGIISGKLLGKVKDEVKPADPKTPDPPVAPPDPIGKKNPDPVRTPKPDNNGNNGGGDNGGGWRKYVPPIINPNPVGGNNGGCLNVGNGCLNLGGCLSNIWRLLLALLLLLFILWFLKGCLDNHQKSENCCGERDSLLIENNRIKSEIDSIKRIVEKRNDSIQKDKIQEELDELSSKVYFYGGTVKIRKFSENQINKIVYIIQKNNNLEVEIRGFYNGNGTPTFNEEYNSTIDVARAKHIKKLLIEKGVDENLVSAVGMGESTLDPSDEDLMQKIELDGEEFKWNRNMRVEIKIVKY